MKAKKMSHRPGKPANRELPNEDRTFTVRDVAELDSCSEKTVRRAIASGMLAATRIGPGQRLWRITREAHAQYRRAHRA